MHLHEYEGREEELQKVYADLSQTPLPMDVYYPYREWQVKNAPEKKNALESYVTNYPQLSVYSSCGSSVTNGLFHID